MRLLYLRLLTSLVLLLLGLMLSQRSVAGVHNFPQPSSSAGAEKIADMDEFASRVLEKLKNARIKVIAVTPFSLEKIGVYRALSDHNFGKHRRRYPRPGSCLHAIGLAKTAMDVYRRS